MRDEKHFFDSLKFKYSWRAYQERVLNRLEGYIGDHKLHVVAAPGSGKTVLGLEVMLRLRHPTLILAPSLTIRNQWVDRLTTLFLSPSSTTSAISRDIHKPQLITVCTYQGLHAAIKGRKKVEEDELVEVDEDNDEEVDQDIEDKSKVSRAWIDELKNIGIKTIILDEAHHLRKEWWKALDEFLREINNPKIVSLTATPPYDVSYQEWKKYHDLCGPVDEEISVPELVSAGDLCPHQDYIYFSRPTEIESQQLKKHKEDLDEFTNKMFSDLRVREILLSHVWFKSPEIFVEQILSDPSFFSTGLIFLNHVKTVIPDFWLKILGVSKRDIPPFGLEECEELLNQMIFKKSSELKDLEGVLGEMKKNLQRMGVIERRIISIKNPKQVRRLLARSVSKIESIVEIVKHEKGSLFQNLRMVILTDFIRRSDFPVSASEIFEIKSIGVVPIFERLRREHIESNEFHLSILTGTIVVIPVTVKERFLELARQKSILEASLRFKELEHDPRYVRLEVSTAHKHEIVGIVTQCFSEGRIQVIVGTAALLGEGWDSPTINALVMASYVGSFMLSNQMRGRAIRKDPNQPAKVSNIWHLAAIDPFKPHPYIENKTYTYDNKYIQRYIDDENFAFQSIQSPLGEDVDMLKRRMMSFEAPSHMGAPVIENGIRRFKLSQVSWRSSSGIADINDRMLSHASDRVLTQKRWQQALLGSSPKPQIIEKISSAKLPGVFFNWTTLVTLLVEAGFLLIFSGHIFARVFLKYANVSNLWMCVSGIGAMAIPRAWKALWLWFRNGSLEGNMSQLGQAILEGLHHIGEIKTKLNSLRVKAVKIEYGVRACSLEGATTHETQMFLDAMEEVLGPIENPRYILIRKSSLIGIGRIDYHNVPAIFGAKKEYAEEFLDKWQRMVGDAELVYTRTPTGRSVLLKARTHSFSSAFQPKPERMKVWE